MKSKIFSFNAIITFVLIAFLFGVTEIGFFYISKKVTADCWENLHQIAKNADSRLVFVSRSQMGALINITDLFTSVETFDNPEVGKYIQEVRIGPLQAPVRVYRRNGYYIYEKGSGTNPKVVGLLNKYFSPAPYITPIHEDVFRPGVMVAEQFFPIRYKGGQPFGKASLLNTTGISAAIDDGLLDIQFRVVGFETTFFDNSGNAVPELSDGPRFSNRQKRVFDQLGRGKRFYIQRVKAIGPDGIERQLNTALEVILN